MSGEGGAGNVRGMMFSRLATFAIWLTFAVIILGAATRLADAGLSCPDWPLCYGEVIPFPESKIAGGYVVEGTHYVAEQVALEYAHRLTAALVGVLLLGMMLYLPTQRPRVWVATGVAFALLAAQIKLGALTVWLGNIHWSVAIHLGNAMLFLGALAWARRASVSSEFAINPAPRWAMPAVALTALCVWATMMLGAFISSGYAGGICGGLFSCQGEWIPQDMLQLMHMKHRYLALATFILVMVVSAAGKRSGSPLLIKPAKAMQHVVGLQVILGIFTLYSFSHFPHAYHALSLAHLTVGTALWFVLVGTMLNLVYGLSGRFHQDR